MDIPYSASGGNKIFRNQTGKYTLSLFSINLVNALDKCSKIWYNRGMVKRQRKFRRILEETRAWAEDIAKKEPECYTESLCGLCAIVSKELFKRLKKEGYECSIGYNFKHCFVLYKNRVLDLTATQFNKPRIYIPSKSALLGIDYRYWKIEKVFTNIEELSNYQYEEGWYSEQIAIP